MAEAKNQYAVVLTFPAYMEDVFAKLREKYDQYLHYVIEPHVTLAFPMTPKHTIMAINDKLEEVAGKTEPFAIILDGIEFFEGENNVAYVAVVNKPLVTDLHTRIMKSLKGLVEITPPGDAGKTKGYIPHATIGEKIPGEIFQKVRKTFSSYKIHYECVVADFSLFSEVNGVWSKKRVFKLMG